MKSLAAYLTAEVFYALNLIVYYFGAKKFAKNMSFVAILGILAFNTEESISQSDFVLTLTIE